MSNTRPDYMVTSTSLHVSVIVPAYNAAETIAEVLASLCSQTHTAWEAIVVDDGSSDGTVAASLHWPILGHFFQRTLYPELRLAREAADLSLYRGGCRLACGLPAQAPLPWPEIHDRIDWTVFLQEIWGYPEWRLEWFYRDNPPRQPAARSWRGPLQHAWSRVRRYRWRSKTPKIARPRHTESSSIGIEISGELPDIAAHGEKLGVLLTVGGVAVGLIPVVMQNDLIPAHRLRAVLTEESGLDLCRAAVRECVLGRSMASDPTSLRVRLAVAAAQPRGHLHATAAQALGGPSSEGLRPFGRGTSLAAGLIVLGRRTSGAIGTSVSRRAMLLTFDDGYLDFYTYAWPLLQHHGFSATVFLVSGAMAQSNSWDWVYGEKVPLLGQKDILRLRDAGITFGSHAVSHRPLTGLSPEEVVRGGIGSRLALERTLGAPIGAFAYPYGDTDQIVQHFIGACGYVFGLSCRHGLSAFDDALPDLPRLEVSGTDRFQDFVLKLEGKRTTVKRLSEMLPG